MKMPKAPDAAAFATAHGPEALRRIYEKGGEPPEMLLAAPGPTIPTASGNSNDESAVSPPNPAAAARVTLERAVERVKAGDKGAHLEPEVLAAWVVLQEHDPAAAARSKGALKGTADLRALDKCLRDAHASPGLLRVAGVDEPAPTVIAALPDAPVPLELIVPPGYILTSSGISKHLQGRAGPYLLPVAAAPVVIAARVTDADGMERWRLAWKRRQRWQVHTAGRGECLDPKRLIGLAAHGAPIWGGSAGPLAEYLHDFESANLDRLPFAQVSDALGWQGPRGERGFLCGRDLITPNGETLTAQDLDALDPLAWSADRLYFGPASPGDSQLADSVVSSGTLRGWREAITPACTAHPRAAVALYASLAAPLLSIVRDVPNFCIDWSFSTSTGKTSILRVAASVWGRPIDGVADSFIHSWDATKVWIEHTASISNGLPLILDDSKRAKKGSDVAEVIYGFAHGQGRGRGLRTEGTRKTRSYRSILLSTGEQPLVSFTQDGGTRARVLTLWGPPFGAANQRTGALVLDLKRALLEHHGHAGPRFVSWLLGNKYRWGEFCADFRDLLGIYQSKAGDNPVAGRLAEPIALLHLAARLAHEALSLSWDSEEPFSTLWETLTVEASEADRAGEGLQVACNWALANSTRFYGRHSEGNGGHASVPPGGWVGRWDRCSWGFLAFFPQHLKEILREAGYEPDSVIRVWKSNGWIDAEKGSLTRQVRGHWDGKNSDTARLVMIRRSAYDEVYQGGGELTSDESIE